MKILNSLHYDMNRATYRKDLNYNINDFFKNPSFVYGDKNSKGNFLIIVKQYVMILKINKPKDEAYIITIYEKKWKIPNKNYVLVNKLQFKKLFEKSLVDLK